MRGLAVLWIVLCSWTGWAGVAWAESPEVQLEAGNAAYTASDYAAAAESWGALIADGHATGDLYYNLGNAYYRDGDLGRAMLSWQRATTMLPRDGDVAANLERARRETVDRLDAPSRITPFFWTTMLSLSEQGHLAAWLTGLLLCLGIAQRLRPGLPLGIPGLLIGAPAVLLIAGTVVGIRELDRSPGAVVLTDTVEVRSAAGDGAGVVLFELHAGAEVRIRERLSDHAQIALPDDRRGWLPESELGVIDPRLPMPGKSTSR